MSDAKMAWTHYRALGVPTDASTEDIKKAYRKLARDLHPDRTQSNTTSHLFQAVREAHDVLINPASRAAYDASLSADETASSGSVDADAWGEGEEYMEDVYSSWHGDGGQAGDASSSFFGEEEGEEFSVAPEPGAQQASDDLPSEMFQPLSDGLPSWVYDAEQLEGDNRQRWELLRRAGRFGLFAVFGAVVAYAVFVYGWFWAVAFGLLALLTLRYSKRNAGRARYWSAAVVTGVVSLYGFVDYGLGWDATQADSGLTRGFVFAALTAYLVWFGRVLWKFHGLVPKKRLFNNLDSMDVPWEVRETAREIEVFERLPGAVIASGALMYVDGEPVEMGHVIVCGNQVAVINDVYVAEGVYSLNQSGASVLVDGQFLVRTRGDAILSQLRTRLGRSVQVRAFMFLRGDGVQVDEQRSTVDGFSLATPSKGLTEIGRWFLEGGRAHTVRRSTVEKMWTYVNNYIAASNNR